MRRRSVLETMVLTFTFLVATVILLTAATIMIVEIRNPESDTRGITQALLSIISGILGALLGLIAGRATTPGSLDEREEE